MRTLLHPRSRTSVAVVVAVLVHIGVVLAIARTQLRSRPGWADAASEVSGELTLEPLESKESHDAPAETRAEQANASGAATLSHAQEPIVQKHDEPAASTGGAEGVQQEAAVFGGTLFRTTSPVVVGSLDAPNPFLVSGTATTPTETDARAFDAKRKIDAEIRRASLAEDRAHGVHTEGAIATAITDATYGATLPTNDKASFEIIVDGTGRARFITVAASDPGWQEVAKAALLALQKKQTRFAGAPKGAILRMDVTVGNKLPNGQAEGLRVTAFGIVLKEGGGKDATTVTVLDLSALKKAVRNLPSFREFLASGADRTRRMAERDAALRNSNVEPQALPYQSDPARQRNNSTKGAGSDADPSNLGAKPRTIVHTRTVDVTPLEEPLPQ